MGISLLSIEQAQYVGEDESDQHQSAHDAEKYFVGRPDLGHGTYFSGFTVVSRTENTAPCEEQSDHRRTDENRAVWFQYGQVSNPGAAEAERDQDERAKAASRGKDGCNVGVRGISRPTKRR
jgi:hypothetical protein